MKTLILFQFLITLNVVAQTEAQWQKEIDEQVWKPFHTAFENQDGVALNATYADEVLRVNPGGVDTKEEFKNRTLKAFSAGKKNGIEISLDFWFDSRQTTEDTSYEVGFFKITEKVNGKESSNYGQFHIVVEKIGGVWKITQDWDSQYVNGKAVDERDFQRKEALKF